MPDVTGEPSSAAFTAPLDPCLLPEELLTWATQGGAFYGAMQPVPVELVRGLRGGTCGDSLVLCMNRARGHPRCIPAHDVVFTEQPEVSHPHLQCAYYQPNPRSDEDSTRGAERCSVSATCQPKCCAECLRGLTQPEEVASAGRGTLPRPELWPSMPIVTCCCGDMYCSDRCKRSAWASHHAVLCPGIAEGRGALGRLELFCQCLPSRLHGVEVAPLLLARAAAKLVAAHRKVTHAVGTSGSMVEVSSGSDTIPSDAPCLLHGSSSSSSSSSSTLIPEQGAIPVNAAASSVEGLNSSSTSSTSCNSLDKLLHGFAAMPGGARSLRNSHQTLTLRQLTCDALSLDAAECAWLSMDAYEEALGRVLVNALVIKPKSPFSLYFSSLRGTFGREAKDALIDQVLGIAADEGICRREASQHFEERCAVTGFGLYRLMAKANHDCNPSCHAESFHMADHTIDMVACRALVSGEELTLTYVDPKFACGERQRRLAANYMFNCTCSRCLTEACMTAVQTPVAATVDSIVTSGGRECMAAV